MKERRTREEKENGKEITARNINSKMVESLILRNLHKIKEGKVVIRGVAQMQEEEEEKRTKLTFNVIITRNRVTICHRRWWRCHDVNGNSKWRWFKRESTLSWYKLLHTYDRQERLVYQIKSLWSLHMKTNLHHKELEK